MLDKIEGALLSRATPPVPKVAENRRRRPVPRGLSRAEPGPAEPPTAPELTAPGAPEAVPPAAPAFLPALDPARPRHRACAGGLPDRLAPWLIGFSVLLALFLAFVAARILTWVKKAAQASKGAGFAAATHEALPKAFLHDVSLTTNWMCHRFKKPLTWLGRIVMEPKAEDADHLVVEKGTVSRRHAFIEYNQHDFWITDHDSINGTFVNGRRIHAKARLKHGDHIRLGDCEFRFEMPAMALVQETAVVPGNVRSAVVGQPETDTAADPTSLEPVAPFVAVEIGTVGEDRGPGVAAREGDVTGRRRRHPPRYARARRWPRAAPTA